LIGNDIKIINIYDIHQQSFRPGEGERFAMIDKADIMSSLNDFFVKGEIHEFPIFAIARQGGRTAVEILARAIIMEGKHAYIGQNLTGLRSMGANSIVIRFAESEDIPPGFNVTNPEGALFMHEMYIGRAQSSGLSELTPGAVVSRLGTGFLMVCTPKAPEELDYPVPFEGTVATVDAEAIFTKRVNLQPAPSGITALGLFVAATGDLVSLDAVKEATLAHERLSQKVREVNVLCLQDAFDQAKVAHNLKLPGRTEEKREDTRDTVPRTDGGLHLITQPMSARWRTKLPICDMAKCTCRECFSAYSCPEAAISWQDGVIRFDYNFCKCCGTCAKECVFSTITMGDVNEAMQIEAEKESKS
jgi:pyruvate ferredoxin oxidoreductase delta subunit